MGSVDPVAVAGHFQALAEADQSARLSRVIAVWHRNGPIAVTAPAVAQGLRGWRLTTWASCLTRSGFVVVLVDPGLMARVMW